MASRIRRIVHGDPSRVAAAAGEDRAIDERFGVSMGEEDDQPPMQSDCADLVKQN